MAQLHDPPLPSAAPAPAKAARRASSVSIAGDDARIAAVRAGDRAAAESLLRELLPRVRNLVRYLCRGDGDVDDHAQVALIEILRAAPSFEGRAAFSTFADRITVRSTLKRIKRARAEAAVVALHEPPEAHMEEPRRSPENHTLDRRTLARLLDQLPEEQRQALVLHHVVGLSVPEVARELDLPFDTIKSRLRLAVSRLRALTDAEEHSS